MNFYLNKSFIVSPKFKNGFHPLAFEVLVSYYLTKFVIDGE